jgi:hypothetical protein
MQSVKVRSRVGADGILHLDIPVGMVNCELEVIVIYQLIETTNTRHRESQHP